MADDAYLRESILKPSSKLVAGYARIMPSYDGVLSPESVDELVAAIRALPPAPGVAAAPAPSGGPAEDPVCHMEVATTDPALRTTVDGQTFHFCSPGCRDSFLRTHRPP
jgi:YHS domain-containing protein